MIEGSQQLKGPEAAEEQNFTVTMHLKQKTRNTPLISALDLSKYHVWYLKGLFTSLAVCVDYLTRKLF